MRSHMKFNMVPDTRSCMHQLRLLALKMAKGNGKLFLEAGGNGRDHGSVYNERIHREVLSKEEMVGSTVQWFGAEF